MSDSDDSDVPLALLAAKQKKKAAAAAAAAAPPADDPEPEEESSEEEEFDDGDDDDFEEDMDEKEEEEEIDAKYYSSDSSDDDVPLSKLKSPKKKKPAAASKKKAAAKSPAKKATKAKAKTDTKTKKAAAKKKKKASSSGKKSPVPSGKSSSASSSSRPNLPSFALYDNDLGKGLLIQRFLCRWWYAVEWPDPSTLPHAPPKGYDALNGFPGVYIRTRGSSVGKIVDKRDRSTAPSFANYARKSSEELQGLLLKALAKQKGQLVEAEGPGTETEKDLDKMEKWARKLNCKKLDKDAATALKAAGIRLE